MNTEKESIENQEKIEPTLKAFVGYQINKFTNDIKDSTKSIKDIAEKNAELFSLRQEKHKIAKQIGYEIVRNIETDQDPIINKELVERIKVINSRINELAIDVE